MVSQLLGTDDLGRELEELILEKTEGVPFFIEEFIKSLKDLTIIEREDSKYRLAKEVQAVSVPSTIQDMIMARVDSLPEGAKEVLQTGSVMEREFVYELIKVVSGLPEKELLSHLSVLKDAELLYERGIYPQCTYIFKHALTQVVAYDSLLLRRRQELHRIIGQTIEEIYGDRLAEQYEVLAHHFAQGEEWAKALEYLCKAAEKAAQTFANREAVALFDRALEATEHLGDVVDVQTLMTIHQAKMNLHFVLSDFKGSRSDGERLLALARKDGDRVRESLALVRMGEASYSAHDFEPALAYSRQALEAAEATDAKLALAGAHWTIGVTHAVRGQLDLAKERLAQSLTMSQSVGDVAGHALLLNLAGLIHNWEGEYAEALRLLSEGLRIASERNLPVPLLRCLFAKGLALTGRGDYDEAHLALEEGLAFSEKVGDEVWGHRLLNSLGWLHGECGDLGRAIDLNQKAADAARGRGDPETIANSELNLGDAFLAQGDIGLAQEFLEGVLRIVRDPATSERMLWRYSTHLFSSLGELWLTRGDSTRAQEYADQCLEIAKRTNSRKYLVKGLRLKGEIAFSRRQWEESKAALQKALTIADAISNPTQLWKTHLAMGRLHTEVKRPELARQAYHAACEVINNIKGSLKDPGLRTSLESSPLIRQVYELSGSD